MWIALSWLVWSWANIKIAFASFNCSGQLVQKCPSLNKCIVYYPIQCGTNKVGKNIKNVWKSQFLLSNHDYLSLPLFLYCFDHQLVRLYKNRSGYLYLNNYYQLQNGKKTFMNQLWQRKIKVFTQQINHSYANHTFVTSLLTVN